MPISYIFNEMFPVRSDIVLVRTSRVLLGHTRITRFRIDSLAACITYMYKLGLKEHIGNTVYRPSRFFEN